MTTAIAGLDYNTRCVNLALVRGRELVYHAEHRLGLDVRTQVAVMVRALEQLSDAAGGPCCIWYERKFLQGKTGKGAMKLHEIPTRFDALAVERGFEMRDVPVQTWHLHVLGNGGLKSDEAKRASLWYVERVFGLKADNDNVSDSIAIASYGAGVARLRERVGV